MAVSTELWYVLRLSDYGNWQPTFSTVESYVAGGPAGFTGISCGGVDAPQGWQQLQLVALGNDGQLWHTLWDAGGAWQQQFYTVESQVAGGPGTFTRISCAGVGDQLQLVALGNDSQLWHTLRNSNGTWQQHFYTVESQVAGGPGAFTGISCAGVPGQGQLQLAAQGNDGQIWHTLRNSNGTWQQHFYTVESQVAGGPMPCTATSCAGLGSIVLNGDFYSSALAIVAM